MRGSRVAQFNSMPIWRIRVPQGGVAAACAALLCPALAGMTRLEALDLTGVPMRQQAQLATLLRLLPSLHLLKLFNQCYTQEHPGQRARLVAAMQQRFAHVEIV
jgi:hypothetical protein